MKITSLLIIVFGLFYLTSCNHGSSDSKEVSKNGVSREMPNNDPWYPQRSFFCQEKGFNISILRKQSLTDGHSSYKISVEYLSTISEWCNKARRDVLSNTYSGSRIFSSLKVKSNAISGEYCDKNNNWIIGQVYLVSYPNPKGGEIYTTSEHHSSTLHLDIRSINDLISVYNQNRGSNPAVPNCVEVNCWTPSSSDGEDVGDHPVIVGSRARLDSIRKLINDDIRYIVVDSSIPAGNGVDQSGTNTPIVIGNRKAMKKLKRILKNDARYVEFE